MNENDAIKLESEVSSLEKVWNLQQKYLQEKITEIGSDVKEMKNFLNDKLDSRIDARIEVYENRKAASFKKWVISAFIGSIAISVATNLLMKLF